MFTNTSLALIFSIGFAAWVYTKIMRSSGGNTKNALITAGAAALVAFMIVVTLLGFIPSN